MSDLATAEGILVEVCKRTRLAPEVMRSRNRALSVARPRQACAFALRRRTKWSTTQIAKFLGFSDHTTVIHSVRKAEEMMEFDPSFKALVDALMAAEQQMPLSASIYGIEAKFEAPRPTYAQIRRGTVKLEKPKKPKKPALEVIEVDGRRFTIDQDGNCRDARLSKVRMIAGSKALAKAILMAREATA